MDNAEVLGWRARQTTESGYPPDLLERIPVTPDNTATAAQFAYTPLVGVRWGGMEGGVSLFYEGGWRKLGFHTDTLQIIRPNVRVKTWQGISSISKNGVELFKYEDGQMQHWKNLGSNAENLGKALQSIEWEGKTYWQVEWIHTYGVEKGWTKLEEIEYFEEDLFEHFIYLIEPVSVSTNCWRRPESG